MPKGHVLTGLDIGTNNIKILVAQKNPGEADLEVLDQEQALASGIRKGVVVNAEEVTNIISLCVRKIEERLGREIDGVYVNLSGSHIFTTSSHGLVSVSRADQKISPEDVTRVIQNAQTFSLPSNKEILEIFPKEFIIDGEKGIKEPLGMEGVRLEVETMVLGGFSPYIRNTTQAVLAADLQIDDQILSPLASARAVLTDKEKELGVAVLDIGGGTSELAVFEEGSLIHLAIFPLGANYITYDIAIGLKTDVDIAEKIKVELGTCVFKKTDKKRVIRIERLGGEHLLEPLVFPRKALVEIVGARVSEIFDQTNKELRKISKLGKLPAGIVLTGGGARLSRITELARKELKLPVRIGIPRGFFPAQEDPSFSTVCGLVLIGADTEIREGLSISSFTKGIGERLKKIFRVFIP